MNDRWLELEQAGSLRTQGSLRQLTTRVIPKTAFVRLLLFSLLGLAIGSCSPVTGLAGPPAVTFTDVTKAAGIKFTSFSSPDKKYIVESMAGGVALFDFDGDGRFDIYLVNSCPL